MENNQRNSRKRLNSLILLVAFTAVMLIVSTYAWFSTQRNVTISGLKGKVNVAEGLQVSLDGVTWVNQIDFEDFDQTTEGAWTQKSTAKTNYFSAETASPTFQKPAGTASDLITNVVPSDFKPMSTSGLAKNAAGTDINDGIGQTSLKFYKGDLDSEIDKSLGNSFSAFKNVADVVTVSEPESSSSGYIAFDLFLMNTSAEGTKQDKLQLDPYSVVTGNVGAYGTQNTARVAFALYNNSGAGMAITGSNAEATDSIAEIVEGTSTGKTIKDIAIWEPNAEDHKASIIDSFKYGTGGRITWPTSWTYDGEDMTLPTGNFDSDDRLPTYALTSLSKAATYQGKQTAGADTPLEPGDDTYETVTGIKDIYNWSSTGVGASKLELQLTTQTTSLNDRTNPIDLISIDETINDEELEYTGGPENDQAFDIVANQYQKMRVYVWMEGQDPDCLNYASLGGGLTINLGFSKPENPS